MNQKTNKRTIYTAAKDARISFAAAIEGQADSIGTLKGYAIVWTVPSSDRGGYKVRLSPGSAQFTGNVHALYHHEFRDVLGDLESQTLRILPADEYGVPVEIDLPNTSLGRDVMELVRTQRVRGMSFAMLPDRLEATDTAEGTENYVDVSSFYFDEVTVTPNPAFNETTIEVMPEEESQTFSKENPDWQKERTSERRKLEQYRLSLYRL